MQSNRNPCSMHHTPVSDMEVSGEVLRDDESTNTLTWSDDGCQSKIEVESQTTQVKLSILSNGYYALTG